MSDDLHEDCHASWSDGECVWSKCPVDWKAQKTGADPTAQCPLWTPGTWGNGRDGEC